MMTKIILIMLVFCNFMYSQSYDKFRVKKREISIEEKVDAQVHYLIGALRKVINENNKELLFCLTRFGSFFNVYLDSFSLFLLASITLKRIRLSWEGT